MFKKYGEIKVSHNKWFFGYVLIFFLTKRKQSYKTHLFLRKKLPEQSGIIYIKLS